MDVVLALTSSPCLSLRRLGGRARSCTPDAVADWDYVVSRADHISCGVVADGVAAFEDAQRAAFLELKAQAIEALALDHESADDARADARAGLLELEGQGPKARAQVDL